MNFKKYLKTSEKEEEKNLTKTLSKLPDHHKKLIDGYNIKNVNKTTLDGENVGLLCKNNITISNSWNYGKEFILLHEIGHVVWEKLLSKKDKKIWKNLITTTKKEQKEKNKNNKSLNQNYEELFCMSYATKYAKHPSVVFYNEKWLKFIEKY